MNHRLLFGLITLLAVSTAVAQDRSAGYSRLFRPEGNAPYHMPVGLCEDYPEESTTPAIMRADMELLKRSGVDLLRISFGWDGIEGASGKYSWLFWDEYVKMAVEEYGITLIPYVCYTPSWNSTGDTTNYWNHTPKDYAAFGRFMEALVARYRPWIKTWELWNEPDIDAYWSGSTADLAKLTKIGAEAVRKADPSAKIVLAGLAHRTEFTRELFRDHGISPYVDVVNCHSYFETWSGEPIEKIPDYVNTLADIIARYGNHQSLWMAEVGYSTFRKPDGFVSDSYHATFAYEHTPRYQAVALWRTLTLLQATQKVAAVAWYEIKDLPAGENVIGDVNNRNLGVAQVGHVAKPAEKALKFFNTFFAKPSVGFEKETIVRAALGTESVLHSFRMNDGSVVIVGWLKTTIKGRRVAGTPGNLEDGRMERLAVTVPFTGAAVVTAYDELGNARPFSGPIVRNGLVEIDNLVLKGGEITILKIAQK